MVKELWNDKNILFKYNLIYLVVMQRIKSQSTCLTNFNHTPSQSRPRSKKNAKLQSS